MNQVDEILWPVVFTSSSGKVGRWTDCLTALTTIPFNLRMQQVKLVLCTLLTQKFISMKKKIRGFNTLRQRQNGRHFTDDTFKCIFLNENVWIYIKMSLKFVPKGPINNIPALVQIMVWFQAGYKPLSEPTRMPAFWGYPPPPPPPHIIESYWISSQNQSKVKVTNLKNLPKFQISNKP